MEKGKTDRGPGITARLWDSSLIQNSASESLQIGQRSEMKGTITMKKLMIATAAAFCATVGLAIESANIVGYSALSDEGNRNPGIGSVFMPINEGGTYKLSSITVSGAGEGEYMDPEGEYLQMLNPNGSAVTHRYTYVSREFLVDCFGEAESKDYEGAIGWWNWSRDIVGYIEEGDYSEKCIGVKDPDIDIGTAFLGFLQGNELKFTSCGSVAIESTSFNDNGNRNPFFLNYLPVEIDLTDVTVTQEDGGYMDPEGEYLQVLNPNGSAVTARYTYVSEEFLVDAFGEEEAKNFAGAIGWWNWSRDIVGFIEEADYAQKLSKGDVPLSSGFSFLGFLQGNGLDFNFPAATK